MLRFTRGRIIVSSSSGQRAHQHVPKAKNFENRDLELAAGKLYYASERVAEKVGPILKRSPISDRSYTIKCRLKSPHRIVRKIKEKRELSASSNYTTDDVTDGCGVRIVTLFQNDIPEVVKMLLEMVSHDAKYAEFPFVKDGLR